MPYLGSTPNASFSSRTKQDFTANGSTTAFTLSSAVASPNDIEVFVGNVRQEPTDAYTVNGTTLTMTAAPANGINFYVIFKGVEENSVVPADNSISSAKIASSAVTDAKIASGISSSKLTGALPALDGSALTGLGKVLQVVSYRTAVQANTGGPWASTGLEVSITPSNANNKVLVLVSQPMAFTIGTTADRYCEVQLRRGSSQRAIARQNWQGMWGTQAISEANWVQTFILLDDPSTTSATTYDTRIQVSAGTCDIYAQKGGNSDALITLMEIEA